MEQLGSVSQLVPGSFPTRPGAFWMSTLSDTSIEPLLTIYEFNKVHLISKTSKLSTCGSQKPRLHWTKLKCLQLLEENVSIIFQIVLSITVYVWGCYRWHIPLNSRGHGTRKFKDLDQSEGLSKSLDPPSLANHSRRWVEGANNSTTDKMFRHWSLFQFSTTSVSTTTERSSESFLFQTALR